MRDGGRQNNRLCPQLEAWRGQKVEFPRRMKDRHGGEEMSGLGGRRLPLISGSPAPVYMESLLLSSSSCVSPTSGSSKVMSFRVPVGKHYVSVIACQWTTVCLQMSECRRCMYYPVSISPCEQLSVCFRRPYLLLGYFSTMDIFQPTPEVGGWPFLTTHKKFKISRVGRGLGWR